MHPSFLQYLVDPKTHEALKMVCNKKEGEFVVEGFLISSSNSYPIVRGIPRFSGYKDAHNYTRSFSYEWNKWSRLQFESENIGKPMEGYTRCMWESITGINEQTLGNAVVGDFGCGAGRFIEVARIRQGKVIGIDLSDAVEVARQNFKGDKNVLICQADILVPPIKEGVLDSAFSIGVLHHTPDPYKGFKEISRCVKKGGRLAVSVYGRGSYYSSKIVNLYRSIFKILWPILGHYPPVVYAYTTVYT